MPRSYSLTSHFILFIRPSASGIISTAARAVIGGFFTADILKLLPFGLAAAAAGVFAGKAVFGKLDAKRLKYVIYGFMALSGLLNIINALAGS